MELIGTLIWVNRTNGRTDECMDGRTDSLLELAEFYPSAKNNVQGPGKTIFMDLKLCPLAILQPLELQGCTLSLLKVSIKDPLSFIV